MKLKYLFIVEYQDGSAFKQNAEDVSLIDPMRSAFFDVKLDEVKRFHLYGGGTFIKDKFTVDLTDGHFEVMGIKFFMHDSALRLKNIKLKFYRQHTHNFNFNPGQQVKETAHLVDYCMGWEAEDENGNPIERILEVK